MTKISFKEGVRILHVGYFNVSVDHRDPPQPWTL